jgi:iron complex outermembrane recepter protein
MDTIFLKNFRPAKRLLLLAVAAAVASSGAPSTGWAATRASVLEEVVVTAQRREQSAADVGVAISAFSGEQMEDLGFTTAADVSMQSPNVEIRRHFVGRGLTTNLFVRGVGNTDLNNGAESPVAAFLDDFYLISSSTVDFALYDMARVEVLKGPQGTLFGRNATGGAFSFVTQAPEDEFSAYVEGTAGNHGRLGGELRLNLPVSDKLKLRFSAYHDSHDGFTKNEYPTQGDFRESNFDAYRGQAKYEVTDQWETLLKVESGKAEGRLVGDNLVPMEKLGDDVVFTDFTLTGLPKDENPFKVAHNSKDWASNEVRHVLWNNVWQGDNLTFTSVTGYLDQDFVITEDCDASPISVCNYNSQYDSEHYSQEFRLNGNIESLEWTVGAYYMKQDADGGYNLNVFNGLLEGLETGGVLQRSLFETEVETYAVFGQVEYAVSDSVTLIGGLRAQRDKKTFEQIDVQELVLVEDFDFRGPRSFTAENLTPIGVVLGGNNFDRANAGNLTKLDEDGISGTLQVNWTPTDGALYYASYRRGLKAGGFNVGVVPIGLPAENWGYDQEVLDAYEVGAKLELADSRVRLNLATFHYDYKDYQALSFQNLGQFFVNRPANITGAEFEILANPIDGLDVVFGASFLDTTVEDVQRGVLESTVKDREMGEAPATTANLVVRYEFPVAAGYLSVQVAGNYVAERYADILNQTAATLPSYTLWNSSVTYRSAEDNYFARLWVKNLADKEVATYRIEITDILNYGQNNFMEPRTAGLTLGYQF